MKTAITYIKKGCKTVWLSFLLLHLALFSSVASFGQWQATSGPVGSSPKALVSLGTNLFAGLDLSSLYRSPDNGNSWTILSNGLTYNDYNALIVSGSNVYAGTHGGGVFLSTNNGNNWTAVNNGLTNLVATSFAVSGTNIFVGTQGSGVFLSTNNGSSWLAVNSGLTSLGIFSLVISGSNIFAGTNDGVFLSTNNGSSWIAVTNGLPSGQYPTLAANGTNIFASNLTGGLFLSNDNGTSWTTIGTGLPPSAGQSAFAFDGAKIFAGGINGVYLSYNNGSSWMDVSNGMQITWTYSLTINGGYLFAGVKAKGTNYSGVWRRPLSSFVGINEIMENTRFNIYPNPLTSISILQLNGNHQNADVSITDNLGKELFKRQMTGSTMEINKGSLTSGIYFVRVTADGKQYTEKLVVQ